MRKPKPKALKAGMEPITSEAITPTKISSTSSAAASPGQKMEAGIAAPGPAGDFALSQPGRQCGVCVGQGDIGHKDREACWRTGANSHCSHATNITVLQSFCDSGARDRRLRHKHIDNIMEYI